jgi:hypothetical protein
MEEVPVVGRRYRHIANNSGLPPGTVMTLTLLLLSPVHSHVTDDIITWCTYNGTVQEPDKFNLRMPPYEIRWSFTIDEFAKNWEALPVDDV